MTKFKKSILIFGILTLIIGAALGTIIVLSLSGLLKSEQIALEFTVVDADKTYDGEPLTASEYMITSGRLIEGHTPVITFKGEQTDVGENVSGLDVRIVDERGYDTTDEYMIRVVGGSLWVDPCTLQINLNAQNVIYDGATVDIGNGYTIVGGKLAKGHRVSVQIKDEWFTRAGKTVAGSTLNPVDIKPVITDANGRDVTSNYRVSLSGKISIEKRSLTIAPISVEKTYDGNPLECTQYKIEMGSLASGHYIVPEFKARGGGVARVIDANEGNPLEVIVTAKIYDLYGDDVTDNYSLLTNTGYLTVKRANLTIVAKSKSWPYDGTEHSLMDDHQAYMTTGLASKDVITVDYSGSITDVSNSEVENKIDKYYINGEATDNNYNITVISGKLEITKAKLTIVAKSKSWPYDGKEHLIESDEAERTPGLVDGDEVIVNYTSTVKNVSEVDNIIYDTDYTIICHGEEGKNNYDVTLVKGTLKVTPRGLTLSVVDTSGDYNGKYWECESYNTDSGSLVDGQRLEYKFQAVNGGEARVIDANEDNPLKVTIKPTILDEEGIDVTANYSITTVAGTITVKRKTITVTANSKTWDYDGLPHSLSDVNKVDAEVDLIAGDTISVRYSGSITDYTEDGVDNEIIDYTINCHGEVINSNYTVILNPGKLKINKRNITVVAKSTEKTYDGTPLEYANYSITEGWLVAGHSIFATFKTEDGEAASITDANEGNPLKILFDSITVKDSSGAVVSGNYEINPSDDAVYLTVKQAKLIIAARSAKKTYDGAPLVCNGFDYIEGSLIDGHKITEIKYNGGSYASITDATDGLYEVKLTAEIMDGSGKYVTQNYNFVCNSGYLTIDRIKLTIAAKSAEKDYDGKELKGKEFYIDSGTILNGHSIEDGSILFRSVDGSPASVTDVNSGNALAIVAVTEGARVVDSLGNYVTKNYSIEPSKHIGYLTVRKAPLSVTWKSYNKQYDGKNYTVKSADIDNSYELDTELPLMLDFELDKLNAAFAGITEIGNNTYALSLSDFTIYNKNDVDKKDITDMFNVSVIPGSLKITPCDVEITAVDIGKTYDGNNIFTDGISGLLPGLADGHKLVSVTCESVPTTYAVGSRYETKIISLRIEDANGNNALGYYNVKKLDTKINAKIEKRDVTISSNGYKKVYDGTPLYGGTLATEGLAAGDRLDYDQVELVDAGKKPNKPDYKIFNANYEDVTKFYNADFTSVGELEVKAKNITVYLDYCEIEYKDGGITATDLNGYIRCNELSATNFEVVSADTFTTIGENLVTLDWKATVEDGVIKTNYNPLWGNSKFNIVKGKITQSLSSEKPYDRQPITDTYVADLIAVSGGSIVSSNLLGKVDAGIYDIATVYETAYFIYTVSGTFEIKPIKAKITSEAFTVIYTGQPFKPDTDKLNLEIALADTFINNYTFKTNAVDASDSPYTLSFRSVEIVDSNGEIINSKNFTISAESCVKVKIDKCPISIYIEMLKGTIDEIQRIIARQDTTSLVKVTGDNVVIKFYDEDDNEINNVITIASFNESKLANNIIKIKIFKNGEDVTRNYSYPDVEDIRGTLVIEDDL